MNSRRMLIGAFYELLREHDFDDITVQMVIDRAQLSRGTFYRHFIDKYDIMNSFYIDYVNGIASRSGTIHDTRDAIEDILNHLMKNKLYYRRALETDGRNSFLDFLETYSYEFFSSRCKKVAGGEDLEESLLIWIEMLSVAIASAIGNWVKRDCAPPPDRMAHIVFDFIPPRIREAANLSQGTWAGPSEAVRIRVRPSGPERARA